jgi:hypothetical protein
MTKNHTTVAPVHVTCKVCMKEVPLSEAVVPEASDYVAHFCGVECYDEWRNQPTHSAPPANLPATRDPI